jgi:hypothetical protein
MRQADLLKTICQRISAGLPVERAEALWLLTEADLLAVGRLADDRM